MLGLGLTICTQSSIRSATESFFARGGITNAGQQTAVRNLVLGLQTAGIWGKMIALYPFVGGTSQAHAQNLRADRYNITWVNSPTHNAAGVTGNGTTTYGRCSGLTTTVSGALAGMSIYVGAPDSTHNFARMIGSANAAQTSYHSIDRVNLGSFESERGVLGDVTMIITASSVPARNGLFSINRTSSTASALYRNGSSLGTIAAADPLVLAAHDAFILALNQSETPTDFAGCTLSLAAVHQGLTSGEAATFYTNVQAFQTALGRSV